MKKPGWISFCGWACVFLTAFAFTGWIMGSQLRWSVEFSAVCAVCWLVSIPLFVLWAFASIVHGVMSHKAKLGAAEMAKHLAAMPRPQQPGAQPGARPAPTSPLDLRASWEKRSQGGQG
jgi:hypothetical protein